MFTHQCQRLWIAEGCLLGLFMLASSGCHQEPEMYTVTGKVTYSGEPVTDGTVMYMNQATHLTEQVPLGAAGEYSVRIPPGSYKVIIEPVIVTAPSGDRDYKPNVQNIPRRYRLETTTPFSTEVNEDTVADFDMTDGGR